MIEGTDSTGTIMGNPMIEYLWVLSWATQGHWPLLGRGCWSITIQESIFQLRAHRDLKLDAGWLNLTMAEPNAVRAITDSASDALLVEPLGEVRDESLVWVVFDTGSDQWLLQR